MNSNPALDRLSLNTATTKALTLAEAAQAAAQAGLRHIGLWRDRVAEAGLEEAAKIVSDAGLSVSSLCRGGFLTAADTRGQQAALADNKAAILEAEALGTTELVMVVGGLPASPGAELPPTEGGDRNIAAARERVANRLEELVPFAAEHGVRLALEPLHPMFAADRAVLSTLTQCLDVAAPFDAKHVGVVVDTYHIWWDPQLQQAIERAGAEGRISSYQICDWNLPFASSALLSRGMMGDGFIDFPTITKWVRQAGYTGPIEVEIFNQQIWDTPANQTLETMSARYVELVQPYL